MEDYNKIIESLGITFSSIAEIGLTRPVSVADYQDFNNTLLLVKKGGFAFGKDYSAVSPGDMLFIPNHRETKLHFGKGGSELSLEDYNAKFDTYFRQNPSSDNNIEGKYLTLHFEAKLFDAISYFASLDVPPFLIKENNIIANLMDVVLDEFAKERPGKERIIKIFTEQIVIEVIRYILKNEMFVEQLATNTTYFKDPRLIEIFKYIKNNLSGDLSNKVLASVANVSEDYVGQYFKMLTGINPQDYIEYQRMEKAIKLLRTTKVSIRDIGRDVGYKDTAYFCRRFKMMFGIPAGKMRRREKMIN